MDFYFDFKLNIHEALFCQRKLRRGQGGFIFYCKIIMLVPQGHFCLVFYSKFANNILMKQCVGQEILAASDWYEERNIYFWARDAKSSSAEVDHLVTSGSTVYILIAHYLQELIWR